MSAINLNDGQAKPVPSKKPRLGETPEELWRAIKNETGGRVITEGGSRLLFPTLRVVCGSDFVLSINGQLEVIAPGGDWPGQLIRTATTKEAQEFHNDLDQDRVQVIYLTAAGNASGYGMRRILLEVHSPSGLAFKSLQTT